MHERQTAATSRMLRFSPTAVLISRPDLLINYHLQCAYQALIQGAITFPPFPVYLISVAGNVLTLDSSNAQLW